MAQLSQVITGKQRKPLKMALYAVDGIGKSTFASMAPSPIFIQTEDGCHNIEVPKFPLAETYDDVLDSIRTLFEQDHDYKTAVLDSVDFAEALIKRSVCEDHNISGIEDLGFGKGYVYAREKFDKMLAGLDALWVNGMNIIVIAHSDKVRTDDPTVSEQYDRYTLKLDKRNEPKLREWADIVAFANYDTIIKEAKDGLATVKRAVSYGKRMLYLERSAAYDAKNRYGLPAKMPLDFNTFWEAYQASIS
jgi:hypothetical protein